MTRGPTTSATTNKPPTAATAANSRNGKDHFDSDNRELLDAVGVVPFGRPIAKTRSLSRTFHCETVPNDPDSREGP
jgi:hypothetical protein